MTAREDASGESGRTSSRSRLGRPTQSARPGLDRIECTATHKGLISLFIRFAGNKCRDLGVVLAHLQQPTVSNDWRTVRVGAPRDRRPITAPGQPRITSLSSHQPRKGIVFTLLSTMFIFVSSAAQQTPLRVFCSSVPPVCISSHTEVHAL